MQYPQFIPSSMLVYPHLLTPGLTIVTGSRGIGKSLWCSALAAYAVESGLTVGGIFCPAQFQNGVKTGIWLTDVRTGEQRLLGNQSPSQDCTHKVGRWYFDVQVMQWGNTLLGASSGCDVIVIDEIGPLELIQGEGFQAGLQLLDQREYRSAFVVIRPSLLSDALSRWSPAQVYYIIGGNP